MSPTSADAAVSAAQSHLGQSRLTAGCPWSKAPNVDDCAKFQSFLLYGPNAAGEGPIAWVDNFQHAPGGTYHPGKAGLRRGDVVLFDWEGNGVGNHVEMATIAPNAAGVFQTIGANGSDTIKVAYRNRNGYVLGYFRPAYSAGLSTAGDGPRQTITDATAGLPTSHDLPEDLMHLFLLIVGKDRQYIVQNSKGALIGLTGSAWAEVVKKAYGVEAVEINANDFYALKQLEAGKNK